MNPDLEIYNLLKEHGIKVPGSEYFIWQNQGEEWIRSLVRSLYPIGDIKLSENEYFSYSTDELSGTETSNGILPPKIEHPARHGYFYLCYWKNKWGYYSDFYKNPDRRWLFKTKKLKQLLIWALENYPKQVKEHLNKMEV
jgi:hypothetical protein